MLEQERIGATVLVRAQDGWSALILKDDDTLDMPEIGLAIPLAEFYEGLAFEAQPVEDNDRPAAARHRLTGLDRALPTLSPEALPPHARFVLRHDRRHPVPMLYEERSSESRCGTPMSEIDRDLIPSREEERLLKRALGSAIPEFIARFGADDAVKRVEAELRRARRARSRKLYAFWSAVLAQIDPGRNEELHPG